ncbi:methyltransferase domain-containing protein [Thalassotalea nanhaiensis]|uniref:Methyltransferase domain-containing protein n=1 Tax=Thalassotalea nanhaiensis TaxID=3065648 RepID=A0ABY9TIG9_9GAMM|nr:methyltransferase domain-containing protein [Colwelliaceae bacterium SQ345]
MKFSKVKRIQFVSLLILSISLSFEGNASDIYGAVVNNSERLKSDFAHDEKRKPLDILPFTQIKEGDKVLELGAGGGYTTELLSLLVGKSGKVYAHFLYKKERLENNRLPNVISLREHSLNEHAQVLAENEIQSNKLDAIIIFFVLHDIYLNNEMSDELLSSLKAALKPGGSVIILDNAAKPDSGLANIGDLHRIGEKFVKAEMEKAGFVFDGETAVLRNKQDDHTKPWGDFEGLQDRFAYRFKKGRM